MRLCAVVLLAMFPLVADAGVVIHAPAELTAAEAAAVRVMAVYLSSGAAGILPEVDPASPLGRLPAEAAVREIETRLGPSGDGYWELATTVPSVRERTAVFSVTWSSGIDDLVVIEMVQQRDRWKIAAIRTSAEPATRPALLPPIVKPDGESDGVWFPLLDTRIAMALALPASILGFAGFVIIPAARFRGSLLVVIAGVLLCASGAVAAGSVLRKADPPQARESIPGFVPIGHLLDVRRELITTGEITRPFPKKDPWSDQVANQWRVQAAFHQQKLDQAVTILGRLRPRSTPMMELLRARLSYVQAREVDSVMAYERAMDLMVGCDALWLEAADALTTLGYDARARGYLERAAGIGSRSPNLHYQLSILSLIDGDRERGEKYLLQAWRMKPIERSTVIEAGIWWELMKKPELSGVLRLNEAREEAFAAPSTLAIEVPDGLASSVSGNYLRISRGDASVNVPGGASVAPRGAVTLDASAWGREEAARAIADQQRLAGSVTNAAFAQPAFRERCLRTAAALAEKNRWSDIELLTRGIDARDERVPLTIILYRARALDLLEREPELRKLISGLLRNPLIQRKRDPLAFRALGELLASVGQYRAAIAMLNRARNQMDLPGAEERIGQLALEQKLAEHFSVYRTTNFELRYPPEVDVAGVRAAGEILEKELIRLRADWVPVASFRPVIVNLLRWEDFREYTGSDYISGLFTDRIFLPLAGLPEYPPEAVAIMTHELCHALIAQASGNLAPRWFHESLASRVEMNELSVNAFQHFRNDSYLSVTLLDAVAGGSPDPELIGEAYSIGETTMRFLDARYGRRKVQELIAQFASGADTREALAAVTGSEVEEIDRLAREWGMAQPGLFQGEVIRYDHPSVAGPLTYSAQGATP